MLTTNDFTATGAGARVSGVGRDSGYFATIDPNAQVLRLERHDAGTRVTLGATYDISGLLVTLPASILNVEVKCNGDQISALIDGVERVPPVTDTTYTAAGLAGFYHRVGSEFGDITVDNISGDTLAADTTAPAFTAAPAVTATTSSGHTISATLDEPGTLYGVRLANGAVAPSSAQVKAGQDSTGAAAPEAKSAAAANSADLVFSTGAASTAYDYYIVAEDDETTPNLQAAPTLVNATTAVAGPSIATSPATAFPGQSRTVTGSGFGATQGTGGVTIGGVAQTVTAWSDTSISFTTVLGNNSYGTGKTLQVTEGGGGTVTATIELVADTAAGFGVVTMNSPNTTDQSSVAYQTTAVVATGDQFEWEDINALGGLVVDAQGFVTVNTEGSFRGRFWDATDSTWGAVETFSTSDITAPVTTSVGVPTAGTKIIGQSLDFTANWAEVVNITGTPAVNFTIGGQARQANYASGTGTSASVFSYTIQEGDSGGISVTSLTLDGGTIRDAALNDADLTLNAIGDTSGITVDGIRPVVSVNSLTTTGTDPIITGSSGDATSLTLVVTGIGTYNPIPSGGTWSQQLPISALGDYPMTLNGTDANGNAAVEAAGTLSIVEEIVKANFRIGFKRPARRPIKGSIREAIKS
ncbi:AsmA family protein [Marinobacter alexandrii]|uniref:IPT/TIG domain-containing protein n=1 Tax=Marinobacter alexandrii TaxID=2570351 RepID=UPI001FFFAF2F|nr:AsmA family protein [Marinobacter alexandrii]